MKTLIKYYVIAGLIILLYSFFIVSTIYHRAITNTELSIVDFGFILISTPLSTVLVMLSIRKGKEIYYNNSPVAQVYNLLKDTDSRLWITGTAHKLIYLENKPIYGHCALGWCSHLNLDGSINTRVSIICKREFNVYLPEINDDKHGLFDQDTPKERVIAALKELIRRKRLY